MPAQMGPHAVPVSQARQRGGGSDTDRDTDRDTDMDARISVLPAGAGHVSAHGQLHRLYCKNGGQHVRLQPSGAVDGSRQENDAFAVVKVKAVAAGVVVIRGYASGRYLAMDKTGKLYGTSVLNDECYFIEKLEENHYNTYRSQKYQDFGDWYVGIKKNGQTKGGQKTHKGQNAIYFLPIPVQ